MRITCSTVDIRELNPENCFLHHNPRKDLESILENGLEAKIGENAIGIEKTPKSFFTIGFKGALEIINVWIMWRIRVETRNIYLKDVDVHDQEFYKRLEQFNADHLSRKIYKNEKIKYKVFDYMVDFLKNRIYLMLSLEEGIDFKYDDIDEAKEKAGCFNRRDALDVLYGPTDHTNNNMERWNMHTISGKTIEPHKLKLVTLGDKIDAFSIINYIYNNTDKKDINIEFLDEFIEYISQLDLDNTKKF